jgi:positive regulator of sigma E activity
MGSREVTGTVVGVSDGRASVCLDADQSCGPALGCACCSLGRREGQTIRIAARGLQEGERVRVLMPAYATYVSILAVFVLPVVLFVVGLVVGGTFEAGEGGRDLPTIIGGLCGFGVAVLVALAVNRLLKNSYEVRPLGRQGAPTGDA